MSFLLLGISHHTAPIEEREKLALPESGLPEAVRDLAAMPGVSEALILSTCNRVELLVNAAPPANADRLLEFLTQTAGLPTPPPPELFYQVTDDGVVRHVFRVASSLDSLVVGEPQILGQLKHAYTVAHEAGVLGTELEALLTRAFHAAKRVRTETAIASQPVSVSHAAVDLARQIFGDLRHKVVLLLGAGLMGEAAARYLMQQGANRLLVINRSLARARMLAEKFGGEAFALEQLGEVADRADVVISCTGAPQPLITRADASRYLARRRGRPMLFLDVAVPRDVEPAVHRLENAFVYNVDDLDKVVSSNLAERQQAAGAGEKIVEAEVARFRRRRDTRDLVPTLKALQEHAEALRSAELERLRKRLGPLSPEQQQAVEALTRSLMQKFLHRPLVELKAAATPAERAAMTELLTRLFALEPAGDATEADADANVSTVGDQLASGQ